MPEFQYTALNHTGQEISGVLEGSSKNEIFQELSRKNLHILQIQESRASSAKKQFFLSQQNVSFFTRQLASLLRSGLPLLTSLSVLEKQSQDKKAKQVVHQLQQLVRDGNSFSDSLDKHPKTFAPFYISMVRAGETGGTLEDTLQQLSVILREELELRRKVVSALVYPGFMVSVGFITVVLLLTFVIPKITALFTEIDRQMPLPTLILLTISHFFQMYWWAIVGGLGLGGVVMNSALKTSKGRMTFDRILLRAPVIGSFLFKTDLTRFARVLKTLIANGVPMIKAIEVTAYTISNKVIQTNLLDIRESIRQGKPLSESLKKNSLYPVLMTEILHVGEQSGTLEDALQHISEEYEGEVTRSIQTMVSMMEPILIIVIGGVVGFIVMALLLPIFDLNEAIQ